MPSTPQRLSHLATLCAVTLLCACSEPVQMGSAVYTEASARGWWVAYNRCDPTPGPKDAHGCVAYPVL